MEWKFFNDGPPTQVGQEVPVWVALDKTNFVYPATYEKASSEENAHWLNAQGDERLAEIYAWCSREDGQLPPTAPRNFDESDRKLRCPDGTDHDYVEEDYKDDQNVILGTQHRCRKCDNVWSIFGYSDLQDMPGRLSV